jgi:hypothetical protein
MRNAKAVKRTKPHNRRRRSGSGYSDQASLHARVPPVGKLLARGCRVRQSASYSTTWRPAVGAPFGEGRYFAHCGCPPLRRRRTAAIRSFETIAVRSAIGRPRTLCRPSEISPVNEGEARDEGPEARPVASKNHDRRRRASAVSAGRWSEGRAQVGTRQAAAPAKLPMTTAISRRLALEAVAALCYKRNRFSGN